MQELEKCFDEPEFRIARNEHGNIHSKYLGDRYEPAIVYKTGELMIYSYMFDGDFKDCIHPTVLIYYEDKLVESYYYSSERIQNGKYIHTNESLSYYNCYYDIIDDKLVEILEEYESKKVDNELINFSLLCKEMTQPTFKFAD